MSESKRVRILTEEVLADIPRWIAADLSVDQIAEQLGVTPGTLRVTCSNYNISLDRDAYLPGGIKVDFRMDYRLALTHQAKRKLRARAQALHMTETDLISLLLYYTTHDGIMDAVLDMKD